MPTIEHDPFRTETPVRPSSLACLACRRKHLKCDASSPRCSRCVMRGLECNYTPSKRGCVGRSRRRPLDTGASISPTDWDLSTSVGTEHMSDGAGPRADPSNHHAVSYDPSTRTRPASQDTHFQATHEEVPYSQGGYQELHLINLYYLHFHPVHPILLPQHQSRAQGSTAELKLVIQFIGSHYASPASSAPSKAAVAAGLEKVTNPTLASVQACLLFAISLHARHELQCCSLYLNKALDHALALELNHADGSAAQDTEPAVRESTRRTWWELWITDAYLAAIHRRPTFRCDQVNITTCLPCEESAYEHDCLPTASPTIQQFRARVFADEDYEYSSFAYRIEATQIIARLLTTAASPDATPDAIQAIDNAVATWKHHLPVAKTGMLDENGELDHLMFQAQGLVHFATILLHFPRSGLPLTLPSASQTVCVRGITPIAPTSTQHAVKAIAASKEISSLAALPAEQYSPFFVCGLVFACMAQLSACAGHAGQCYEQHRERVALMTGVLKSISRTWELANCALSRLRPVANEIFDQRKRDDHCLGSTTGSQNGSHDSGVDLPLLGDLNDLNWFDLFENMQNPSFEFT